MEPQEKAAALLDAYDLCDHCLGRQFARLGHGLENWERGLIVRAHRADEQGLAEESFAEEHIPDEEPRRDTCDICNGLFAELDHYVERVRNALDRYEFDTYLMGCRVPADVSAAEEALWEEHGRDWVEPIKGEINRLIGKRVGEETGTTFDTQRPDVNPVLDIGKDRVELQVNSLLIHGYYSKYARGIPQTKWPCGECRGSGCEDCDWTGKQYQESVEELISGPVKRETNAVEATFHGAGREDVDARCLGKREFVLEVKEPLVRDLDLQQLQEEINEEHGEKIEVFDLTFTEKDMVERVKSRRAAKTYRARIALDEPVEKDALDTLQELVGTVQQETPSRVAHRRADKVREREVSDVSWERLDDTHIELEVTAAAGTYIKELISGDGDRTAPSVAGLLGVGAACEGLDVIAFDY